MVIWLRTCHSSLLKFAQPTTYSTSLVLENENKLFISPGIQQIMAYLHKTFWLIMSVLNASAFNTESIIIYYCSRFWFTPGIWFANDHLQLCKQSKFIFHIHILNYNHKQSTHCVSFVHCAIWIISFSHLRI